MREGREEFIQSVPSPQRLERQSRQELAREVDKEPEPLDPFPLPSTLPEHNPNTCLQHSSMAEEWGSDGPLHRPTFRGERTGWPQFEDRFEAYVNEQIYRMPASATAGLIAEHKVKLLKGCLPIETAARAQYERFLRSACAEASSNHPLLTL